MLLQWLAEGHLVICNRYVPANLAHQGSKLPTDARRREFFDWDCRLEYEVFGLPQPDLQVLLDMPPEVAVRLVAGRNASTGRTPGQDIHEADAAYLAATAAAYRQIAAERRGRWAVVGCTEAGSLLPPEAIAESVWVR